MALGYCIAFLFLVVSSMGQRPSYAGKNPIGYPILETTTDSGLGNRFGNEGTERLPLEALGDRDLVNRLDRLPMDKQPFWYINWRAYEAYNRYFQQTYNLRPNVFIDPIPTNQLNQRQQWNF